MYNKRVVELEQNMISLINNSELHIATVKLVVDKVARMINDTLQTELKKEEETTDNINQ